jgi:hypothetical protein
MGYLISWITGLLLFGLLSAPGALSAATWTIDSLNSIGCNQNNITFSTTLSGYTGGNERFRTTVDQAGLRYMDEDPGEPSIGNGSYPWRLYARSSGGPTTGTWPLAQDTPITVHFMLIAGPGGPPVFDRQVVLSQCNGGTITSDQVLINEAIPTLNEWGMIVFMICAGFGAVCYLRRQRRAES